MTGIFEGYQAAAGGYDEMFAGSTDLRDIYADLHSAFTAMSVSETRTRADALATSYIDQGVTFDIGGEERPFPLDIMPRLIEADRWRTIEAGVIQRVRAIERFLDDVYDSGQVFTDGVMPYSVATTSAYFYRAVAHLKPPNGVRVHVSGIDLIRDADGDFRVLEDNIRCPSGVSYVMTNRRAMSAALPEVFAHHRIRPVSSYPSRLLAALRAAAPAGVDDPNVVVLTPGVHNSAYFEHALLARSMGIELVEGRDLLCRGGRLMMRTTIGLQPVHVVYRRIDDEFLDPVHFRATSLLGCPGLLNAARAGNVTIANAVGNGVADDKLTYTYVPDLIRYYLGEEPILRNVDTWRLDEPRAREEVLDRLDELVLKPVHGSGGKGIVIGPAADAATLADVRAQIHQDPRGWIAQPVVRLSTVPTMIESRLRPRHVDLRPFAVNDGENVWVLPGGLTRVALPEGELVVNSSRGGGSKDTWVLAPPYAQAQAQRTGWQTVVDRSPQDPGPAVSGEALGGQQQEEQQQQQRQGHQQRQGQQQRQQQRQARRSAPVRGRSAC